MHPHVLLVHYAELALKGGNRPWFEERLRANLLDALKPLGVTAVRRERGRIVADLPADAPGGLEEALARLGSMPGVAWYAAARQVEPAIEAIEAEAVSRARGGGGGGTFRVDARRADKRFPLTSMEVNRRVGAAIQAATGRPVDLDAPGDTYGIEIAAKGAFVWHERREGVGGLPVGTSGKVVALISGGLDSPVASWRMMRRGCRVLGVHFLNRAAGGEGVEEKLDLLGAVLARTQGAFTLRIVPFEPLQRAIVAAVPADHRMVVYRRTMLRLADRVRAREGAKALVTGDSVGQVASQTLENLAVAYAAVPGLVLAPLCGEEKTAIVDEARRIGTYEASILPYPDCCSFLIDPHPETRARREAVEEMERGVEWGDLPERAIQESGVRKYAAW